MPDGEIIVGHDVDGNPVRVRVISGELPRVLRVDQRTGKTVALDEIMRLAREFGMSDGSVKFSVQRPPDQDDRRFPEPLQVGEFPAMSSWMGSWTGLRRPEMAPTTVRTIYYRGTDSYRIVVCAGDEELNTVDVVTTGGLRGRDQAEAAAESAAFIRMLPTSWIDAP